MKKMRMSKRFLALALSLILALGLTSTAFAANDNINLKQVDSGQLTTFMASGGTTSVTLYTTTTGAAYNTNDPFSTTGKATAIQWGFTDDGSTIASSSVSTDGQLTMSAVSAVNVSPTPAGITPDNAPSDPGYYSAVTINLNTMSPTPNVYSIIAMDGSSWPVNFTIVIENTTPQSDVTGIEVTIIDDIYANAIIANEPSLNVAVPTSGDVIHGLGLAMQNDPCATGSLQAMIGAAAIDDFTVDANGSYVDEITISSMPYPNDTVNWIGWQYGVYRGGTLLDLSAVVSSSVFPLEDNDQVLWYYGYYTTLPTSWPTTWPAP